MIHYTQQAGTMAVAVHPDCSSIVVDCGGSRGTDFGENYPVTQFDHLLLCRCFQQQIQSMTVDWCRRLFTLVSYLICSYSLPTDIEMKYTNFLSLKNKTFGKKKNLVVILLRTTGAPPVLQSNKLPSFVLPL